jgi:tyrosyl-tRNA synthetase
MTFINSHEKINEVLTRGVEQVLPTKEGLAKIMSQRPITLYQGFDPSMPSLHLGNLVGVMKLRAFQKLGHKVIFLIGDFTGMIGDPSDKLAVRKKLSREEVLENSQSWMEQTNNLLDFKGPNKVEVKYNSEWSDKMTFLDLIEITSNLTVQQMIERDMFQKRLKNNEPIYLHEFLYPVAQGYDSVAMGVDLEIGGNDQVFNMLTGRTLMKAIKNKEKFVLATKLLVDKEGNKAGKTAGNALFLDAEPSTFFGGIMSFPDETILPGFELLTEVDLAGLDEKIKKDPMIEKKHLAYEIVKLIWSESDAESAKKHFEKTFQEKAPQYAQEITAGKTLAATITPVVGSTSEAKRLIIQGAVDVAGKKILDPTAKINVGDNIKVGTKIFLKAK